MKKIYSRQPQEERRKDTSIPLNWERLISMMKKNKFTKKETKKPRRNEESEEEGVEEVIEALFPLNAR